MTALVARLAHRIADRGVAGARGRRPLAIAFAAAVALLIAAGGAAAWVSVRGLSAAAERAPRAARGGPPAGSAAMVGLAPPRAESPVEVPVAIVPPPLRDATPPATAPAVKRRTRAEHAPPPDTEPTAADLFAAANAARRARDLHGALDRYLALERRFPDSEEALVSLVSAADLLARRGASDGALRAFDRYLARRPEGPLAPEALFGRARALKQLGRTGDEIDAWRRLLRVFPGSMYEPAGRQRLDELSR